MIETLDSDAGGDRDQNAGRGNDATQKKNWPATGNLTYTADPVLHVLFNGIRNSSRVVIVWGWSVCEGAGGAQGNCYENLLGALKNRIHTVSGVTVILNGR